MIDEYGRNIDYVRISVTDRCNLRCIYCMPEEGIDLVTHKDILSFDEIWRLAGIMAGLGIRKIKLTGGEPLVRKGVPALVKGLKGIKGIEQVTLTTNGVLLEEHFDALREAGLDAVNISIDTLDGELYRKITRGGESGTALKALYRVIEDGSIPVKINCVLVEYEERNILDMAGLAEKYPVCVRFIEMMPIGCGRGFEYVPGDRILGLLEKKYGIASPVSEKQGSGPCRYFSFKGFAGKAGFINPVSHAFCTECSRIRLTSKGLLKTCLSYKEEADLMSLMRRGATDTELAEAIKNAVKKKPAGHSFCCGSDTEDKKIMSQIGG